MSGDKNPKITDTKNLDLPNKSIDNPQLITTEEFSIIIHNKNVEIYYDGLRSDDYFTPINSLTLSGNKIIKKEIPKTFNPQYINIKTISKEQHPPHTPIFTIKKEKDGHWKINLGETETELKIARDHFPEIIAHVTRLYLLANISLKRDEVGDIFYKINEKNEETNKKSLINPTSNEKINDIFERIKNAPGITFSTTCFFLSICIWLPILIPAHYKFNTLWAMVPLIIISSIWLGFPFFTSIRNILKTENEDEFIKETIKNLKKIQSDLSLINTKVAACHIAFDDKVRSRDFALWYVAEPILRDIDDKLKIKQAFASLDKVINMQSLLAVHKDDKEHRLHAAKSITAAGSGIFTGFFTYEVGESVLKYIHATGNADDRSLHYWLYTKAGVAAGKVENVEFSSVVAEHTTSTTAEAGKSHTTSTTAELDKAYHEKFAHHEIMGQACLLTVTLIVTFLAMYISYKKPHDAGEAGHGHH